MWGGGGEFFLSVVSSSMIPFFWEELFASFFGFFLFFLVFLGGKIFDLRGRHTYQIIGGPPKLQEGGEWTKPSLVLSGPHQLNTHLAEILNVSYVGDQIGKASGLKCCFAATSKGLVAIAVQSLTTAKRMGVLEEMREMLGRHSPAVKGVLERGVGGCP